MPKLINFICAVSKVTHADVPCMEILLKYGAEKYSAWNAWKTCTLIEENCLKCPK